MSAQARILLLCDDRRGHANTVLDHIDAFRRFSRHDVRTFNPKAMRTSALLNLDDFDVVVVHYSIVLSDPIYMSPSFVAKLRAYRGLKVQFIQDEYRWVDRVTAAARDAGIGVLFTAAPDVAAKLLYDERLPGVRRVHTLTGYVPENLVDRPIVSLADRPLDVCYRARDLPYWYGRLAREKAWIGQGFAERARSHGLRCDIAWSEQDRIYGDRWIEFVSSSRATLGCESGASIADFDGGVERAVRAYLRAHPGAGYEEVHDAVLRPYEGNVVINVVSPRVFEAACLGTALVMFPGDYSGVMTAGRHYIPLQKDFSNMAEVAERLHDDDFVAELTRRTREEVVLSGRWSYRSFVAEFDQVMDEEVKITRGPLRSPRWRLARAERAVKVPGLQVRFFRAAHALWSRLFRQDTSMRFTIEYGSQVQKAFFTTRILLAEPDLRALLSRARALGAPLDRSLRELMEFSLLRKAALGAGRAQPDFGLEVDYDPERKALSFVSVPMRNGSSPHHVDERVHDAVGAGELKIIEWDHRALGGKIQIRRPRMVVGVGYEGLENFGVLASVGHSDPPALERALGPMLAVRDAAGAVERPIR